MIAGEMHTAADVAWAAHCYTACSKQAAFLPEKPEVVDDCRVDR